MLPHSASSSQSRQTLSEVIEIYISDRSAHWSAKTKAEFTQYLSTLLSLIGDKPNPDISRSNCIACRSKLQSLPPNFTKKKQFRGMSAKEIAEGSVSGQSLSSKTVNKYLTLLSSFFKWAIKKGAISSNPAEGLLLSQSKPASEEREVYSLEDIQLIRAKLPRLDNESEKFWIPMIAMYSGMRMD